jgi:hypothetical protein
MDARPAVEAPDAHEPRGAEPWTAYVQRLSAVSVRKHFDAYADIPWDDPAFAIHPDDPRWEYFTDPLGRTAWYRAQPPGVRSRMGLYHCASAMKAGLLFENVLERGLLAFAAQRPNGDPAFRYAYHEAIEESHHTLMFQEFVNRAGFDVPGMPWHYRAAASGMLLAGRFLPEFLFLFALGGESPLDHMQRTSLRDDPTLHPLLERIFRHHVTEEARHMSFARRYLAEQLPRLGLLRRAAFAVAAPIVLGLMARISVESSPDLLAHFQVPPEVVREAYTDNPAHAATAREAVRSARQVIQRAGLAPAATRWLWRAFGIWED